MSLDEHTSAEGTDARRLRAVAILDVYPWPSVDGYRQRAAELLRALVEVADVDLFVVEYDDADLSSPPPVDLVRVASVVAPLVPVRQKLVNTLRLDLPVRVAARDWDPARRALDDFTEGPYDVVWYSHGDVFAALPRPDLGPAIVDLDNLEGDIIRLRRDHRRHADRRRPMGASAHWRDAVGRLRDGVDETRWSRIERRAAAEAALVAVCSDADRARLMAPNAVVVPNGYEWEGPVAALPRPPQLLMVGMLRYQPNLEAATYLATEVLPRVRRAVPDTEFHLVGRSDCRIDVLRPCPGIVVHGQLADLEPRLAAARAMVVPVLTGSGTRIKILEGWAHGIPVVTTSVGGEGLDGRDGVELLVAEGAEAFADACIRVLTDDALWERLSHGGRERYERDFRWSAIRPMVGRLVREVVAGTSATLPPAS